MARTKEGNADGARHPIFACDIAAVMTSGARLLMSEAAAVEKPDKLTPCEGRRGWRG